jgi:hypothetical protein
MNQGNRSNRNLQSLARTGFAHCVSAPLLRTERKGLGKASICAFLAISSILATVGVMAGCNTRAASAGSQTPLIAVVMMQLPPSSMIAGNSAMVSATVSNDPSNAGVDWVATCASAPNCGTFTPGHTASGDTTIYTAPPGVPSKKAVTVTALSTTDRSKSSTATVTITSTVTGIVITPALPGSLPGGSVFNLGAIVTGDPANLGVDWTITCPTPNGTTACASNLHSSAGGTVALIVPETVLIPGTTQTMSLAGTPATVTAFATADHSVSISAVFTITAAITINITQAPPASLMTNASAPVTAVVSNDTTNAGVSWEVACEQAPCGSIVPAQTASGVATTFTAPPVAAPGQTVTITAFATATNQTIFSRVTVNITAPISISITQGVVNNTIVLNASSPVIATVSNDSANAGADWTVTCGSAGACGTFSPTHTASGSTTTYTAPSAVPAGNTVTITATSTADPTKNAQQVVTVTSAPPPNSLLQGQFVISLNARNSQNGPFVLGGVISGNGNGTIIGGNFDLVDATRNAEPALFLPVVPPSTYSIGSDGRGQIQLTISTSNLNTNFGVPATATTSTLTLSVTFVTPQHALLTETDTFGNATGTLDLQNAADLASFQNGTAGLNGTYSLQLTGTELSGLHPGFFVAAAIASQASGSSYTFTGYTADQSANGAITSVPFTVSSQNFGNSPPSPLGEISLSAINLGLPGTFSLDLWLIDANHFVVTDFIDATSASPILVGGYLTLQPASPALSGTVAFTEAGATTAAQPQVAGGILSCGSTGTLDVTPLSGTALSNQSISATCSGPSNGRGLVSISGAGASGIGQLALYPTLDRGFYVIELDGGAAGTSGPSGAGVAFQQTLSTPISSSALNGNYGAVFSAITALGSEAFTGQVISDGASNLSGLADVGSFDTTAAPPIATPSVGVSLAGSSFTAASNGRFPLTLTLTPASGQPTPQVSLLHPACYLVDANTCLLVGLDANAPGTGVLQLQSNGL